MEINTYKSINIYRERRGGQDGWDGWMDEWTVITQIDWKELERVYEYDSCFIDFLWSFSIKCVLPSDLR